MWDDSLCSNERGDEKSLMNIDAAADRVNNFHGPTSFEKLVVEEEDID
jgi:hypothetical protein